VAKKRCGSEGMVVSCAERLSQTPWWNITWLVGGTEPSARTRFGLMRVIHPSTGGFSPATGL
jgi:hypothetical protein